MEIKQSTNVKDLVEFKLKYNQRKKLAKYIISELLTAEDSRKIIRDFLKDEYNCILEFGENYKELDAAYKTVIKELGRKC